MKAARQRGHPEAAHLECGGTPAPRFAGTPLCFGETCRADPSAVVPAHSRVPRFGSVGVHGFQGVEPLGAVYFLKRMEEMATDLFLGNSGRDLGAGAGFGVGFVFCGVLGGWGLIS